jgi:hypothetical protein
MCYSSKLNIFSKNIIFDSFYIKLYNFYLLFTLTFAASFEWFRTIYV